MPRRDRPNIFDLDHTTSEARAGRATREARRNKPRSDMAGTRPLTREPKLTATYAYEFVKLLHAGIPPLQALSYFAPKHYAALLPKDRATWLAKWLNARLLVDATTTFNKAKWQDLDKDSRLTIALDKHMAELAYFLYTSNYQDVEGQDLKKSIDARTAILTYVKEGDGDSDTPFMKAMKDLLAGRIDGQVTSGPPQMGESVPAEKVKMQS